MAWPGRRGEADSHRARLSGPVSSPSTEPELGPEDSQRLVPAKVCRFSWVMRPSSMRVRLRAQKRTPSPAAWRAIPPVIGNTSVTAFVYLRNSKSRAFESHIRSENDSSMCVGRSSAVHCMGAAGHPVPRHGRRCMCKWSCIIAGILQLGFRHGLAYNVAMCSARPWRPSSRTQPLHGMTRSPRRTMSKRQPFGVRQRRSRASAAY